MNNHELDLLVAIHTKLSSMENLLAAQNARLAVIEAKVYDHSALVARGKGIIAGVAAAGALAGLAGSKLAAVLTVLKTP